MLRKEIIVNNLKVNYWLSENFQAEQAIIFLPGWNSPAKLFSQQIAIKNLLALDLPGFFGSERPLKTWGTPEYAEFLGDFLIKLGITEPILVGHSFGGAIALRYAANNQKVKKLILIGAAIIRVKTLKVGLYYIGAKIFKTIAPFWATKLKKYFYQKIDSVDYLESGNLTDIYKQIIREDSQNYLSDIKNIPTALIWGEIDSATPLDQAYLIKSQLPQSELFVLKGAGHYCFLDKKTEFEEIFSKVIYDY